eukprot:TRINITY_DN1393_c1_g1_i2.p1 TRINITY_DN1393_c1_g1~~TRINITY_DN1393_c1_g1_i2.p1  ORF type:complete len:377 (+),score=132.80 TRINITY_DN1393_c1_g1_i2:43-1131(+)
MSVSFAEEPNTQSAEKDIRDSMRLSTDVRTSKAFQSDYEWLNKVLDGQDDDDEDEEGGMTRSISTAFNPDDQSLSEQDSLRMKQLESFYSQEEEANVETLQTMRSLGRKQTIVGKTHAMLLSLEGSGGRGAKSAGSSSTTSDASEEEKEEARKEEERMQKLKQVCSSEMSRLKRASKANTTSIPVWVLKSFLPNQGSGDFDIQGYDEYTFAKSSLSLLSPFVETLMSKDFAVAEAYVDVLMKSKKWKEIVPELVESFGFYSFFIKFLKVAISKEIAKTKHTSTLFRQNSLASKMLTYYSTNVAFEYMISVLKEPIMRICDPENKVSFELDPEKLPKDEEGNPIGDVDENRESLRVTLKQWEE